MEIWDAEVGELHCASNATGDYAENNYGVGILIHLGLDIPNAKIKNGDQLGLLFVNHFNKHGVKAQYFLRKNDGRATGITYHIGHLIHGSENGTEVKGLKTAWELVPEVIKQMKIGYARVSTTKQNLDRQIAALRSEWCEQIYRDKA